jgi:hypothetical protein
MSQAICSPWTKEWLRPWNDATGLTFPESLLMKNSIMEKIMVLDARWHISGIVFRESSNTGLIMEESASRSRRTWFAGLS